MSGSASGALPSASARAPGTDTVFEIRDAATHAPMPGKLTFIGVSGTPSPTFTTSDAAIEDDRSMRAWNRLMTLSGTGRVAVPRGTYDVYVGRGPEWSMHVVRGVELGASEVTIQAELVHEVPTPGWVSGDFHVHAERSWDSKVPMRARVYEFIAEGVDVIVATDHNEIADYGPAIRDLGVTDLLASVRGDEVTTKDWGHFGVFPLGDIRPFAAKGRTPTQIFKDVREAAPSALVNVNHPRFDRGLGYFRSAIFDRTQAAFGRTGASLDFDSIEVLNGYEGSSPDQVDEVLKDWFVLLAHGHVVSAMGNSDTHRLDTSLAGYPRNFVPSPAASASDVSIDGVVDAIRKKRSFFTTGPFLELTHASGPTGDVVRAEQGKVTVHVRARAASWISVDTLTIYVGGKVALTRALAPDRVLSFDEDIALDATEDTHVVARVDGKTPLPPVVGDGAKLVAYPMAVTNPIFVDGDGDGKWTPSALKQ